MVVAAPLIVRPTGILWIFAVDLGTVVGGAVSVAAGQPDARDPVKHGHRALSIKAGRSSDAGQKSQPSRAAGKKT